MSQRAAMRSAFQRGKKISPLSALRDFGCLNFSARLTEISRGWRNRRGERIPGLALSSEWRKQKGKRYKVYRLDPDFGE